MVVELMLDITRYYFFNLFPLCSGCGVSERLFIALNFQAFL